MGDVSVVIIGGPSSLAAGLGEALDVPFLPLKVARLNAGAEGLVARGRLIWIHTVPAAAAAAGTIDVGGVFKEAALLRRSARVAREVAGGSGVSLVFVALLPARGLLTGDDGAACDMATAAMDSLMRVEIGPWSNAGHRLLSVSYAGLAGHVPDGARSDDEILRRTPTHDVCTFRQLADAVRYAGSERAAYVTGTTLHVDGGWNAYSWIYPARTI